MKTMNIFIIFSIFFFATSAVIAQDATLEDIYNQMQAGRAQREAKAGKKNSTVASTTNTDKKANTGSRPARNKQASAGTCPFGTKEVPLEEGEAPKKLKDGSFKTSKTVCLTEEEKQKKDFEAFKKWQEEENSEKVTNGILWGTLFVCLVFLAVVITLAVIFHRRLVALSKEQEEIKETAEGAKEAADVAVKHGEKINDFFTKKQTS
jgi:uncharacterized membrane protein